MRKFANWEKVNHYNKLAKSSTNKKKKSTYLGLARKFAKQMHVENIEGHISDIRIDTKNNKYVGRHLDSIDDSLKVLKIRK